VDERLEQHDVGTVRAAAIAACVVALFNGRPCTQPSSSADSAGAPIMLHPDIEEAFRPEEML
jgi:hypothetical protein